MCYRITCASCGKPSYGGCGRHVESVLGDVRPEDRCSCRMVQPERVAKGWFDSLLGRHPRRPS